MTQEIIINLWLKRMTVRQIVTEIGRSRQWVHYVLKQRGVKFPSRGKGTIQKQAILAYINDYKTIHGKPPLYKMIARDVLGNGARFPYVSKLLKEMRAEGMLGEGRGE